MSLSNVKNYASRIRNSSDLEEVKDAAYKAITELAKEIQNLQSQVGGLQSKVR